MKVRYDDGTIELSERVVDSLKEHMRATVAMMRGHGVGARSKTSLSLAA
jgi:hypothetical protein